MPSKTTANYQSCQWEAGDRVLRTDFNADNAKIDTALGQKAEAAALSALSQTVEGKGNCSILTGSYEGTGSQGRALDLPVKPKVLIVQGAAYSAIFMYGQERSSTLIHGSTGYTLNVTWTEGGLSWHSSKDATSALNIAGYTYNYVVFY